MAARLHPGDEFARQAGHTLVRPRAGIDEVWDFLAHQLAIDIEQAGGFRADVVDSPLDTSPTLDLQGHLQGKDSASMDSRFMLRITRERGSA